MQERNTVLCPLGLPVVPSISALSTPGVTVREVAQTWSRAPVWEPGAAPEHHAPSCCARTGFVLQPDRQTEDGHLLQWQKPLLIFCLLASSKVLHLT